MGAENYTAISTRMNEYAMDRVAPEKMHSTSFHCSFFEGHCEKRHALHKFTIVQIPSFYSQV